MLILIVDDDPDTALLISEAISKSDRQIQMVHNGTDAFDFIVCHQPDLIILDYSLPDMNSGELINLLKDKQVTIPSFIVSTGQGDEMIAVEMMKMGAHDYLINDTSLLRRLPGLVKRAIVEIRQSRQLKEALIARQLSDEKLLEEQRRLANIIKATNVGTWEWDIKTDRTQLNERYANIIGYTLLELEPTSSDTWRQVTHPDDNIKSIEKLDEHFNKKTDYFEIETRVKHKNGHWVWVLNRGCIMDYDSNGKPLLMAGTMQDISDKKLRENLQKEIDVANKTLQFKQNFMASLSHEMRTPLIGIIGISEVLTKTPLDPLQEDYINSLKDASENLRDIIDQVLDYSSIETGKMKLTFKPFEAISIVDEAKKAFDQQCQKPIEFKVSVGDSLPGVIKADQKRINQVVGILIGNAIKYSENGTVSMNISNDPSVESNKAIIRIQVADTGVGIVEEKHEQLFSPFTNVDQIDTSYYEGTGLGLAICKEIVELHGGNIGLSSIPGEGTIFWFNFKAIICEKGEYSKESLHDVAKHPDVKLKILFVEDKTITQKVVKLQLTDMGHQVTVVSNGREAIETYRHELFDIILMDIQMPVMDGISATKELKQRYPDLCPVVGLSANAFEGDRDKYMSLGFDEFITKPMQKEQFFSVINKLFVKK